MIKSQLISQIATLHRGSHGDRDPGNQLVQRDYERVVATVIDEITAALARGHRVELRGFGAFSVRRRAERAGRNPRTGEHVDVKEKFVPFFKAGKQLRERLNAE